MAPPESPSHAPPPLPVRRENLATRFLTSRWCTLVILAAFWVFAVAGTLNKSPTFDEIGHAAGGFTYWKFNDYRLNPESGNLPQRVLALPLALRHDRHPPADSNEWRTAEKWGWASQWFFRLGNDADAMVRAGRTAGAFFAVALAALVWLWARRLFGPWGGLLALLLCVLCPAILANGPLLTADTACAFFLFASTFSLWAVLQRLTVWRVLLAGLLVGGLCVTKASAVLIVPVGLALVGARLLAGQSLPLEIGIRRELTRRRDHALAFAVAGAGCAVIACTVIWASYGFRYSAFAPSLEGSWQTDTWEFVLGRPGPNKVLDQLTLDPAQREQAAQLLARADEHPDRWTPATLAALNNLRESLLTPEQRQRLDALLASPPPATGPRVIDFLRRHELLPEAYLYGCAHVWRFAGGRASFFDGEFSLHGSPWFFPYTFLVKTPLALFGVIALALAAALARRNSPLYNTVPLWTLLVVYWAAAVVSHLNIGHRHLLPTYPPLFVLCGAAAAWLAPGSRRLARGAAVTLGLLVAGQAVETFCWFPNYLAYFNGLVRPSHAYRHLVDSSLDWGQDLPGAKRYLEQHPPDGPVYFSYFGTASPAYYRVPAIPIYSYPNLDHAPLLKVLTVASDANLPDLLNRHPEYDPDVVGRESVGDSMRVVLVKKASALRLAGGTYLISATMLQPVTNWRGAWGPWNARYETAYQAVSKLVQPLLNDDPAVRRAALPQLDPARWLTALNDFDELRFMRLTAFLRRREPDDNINYSILVFRLTDADLARALDGPPPELGPDLPTLLSAREP